MKYMIFCAGSVPFVVAFVWMRARAERKRREALDRRLLKAIAEQAAVRQMEFGQ